MPWIEIFGVFIVSHLAGDFLLQTDWQATHKHGGLGRDPVARRALVSHVATYGLAFVPALRVARDDLGAAVLAVAALILRASPRPGRRAAGVRYIRTVKRTVADAGAASSSSPSTRAFT